MELFQVIADNGMGVGCLIGLLYYIFYDKKQTYSFINDLVSTQKEISKSLDENAKSLRENTETLEKLNLRVMSIEEKLKKED